MIKKEAAHRAYMAGAQKALQDAGLSKLAISLGGIGEAITSHPALAGATLGGGGGAISGMVGDREGAGPFGIGGKSRARMIAERALMGAGAGGLAGGLVGHLAPGTIKGLEEILGSSAK